jgi:hypothetical protein
MKMQLLGHLVYGNTNLFDTCPGYIEISIPVYGDKVVTLDEFRVQSATRLIVSYLNQASRMATYRYGTYGARVYGVDYPTNATLGATMKWPKDSSSPGFFMPKAKPNRLYLRIVLRMNSPTISTSHLRGARELMKQALRYARCNDRRTYWLAIRKRSSLKDEYSSMSR